MALSALKNADASLLIVGFFGGVKQEKERRTGLVIVSDGSVCPYMHSDIHSVLHKC